VSDGNIVAAKGRLVKAVNRLCEPRYAQFNNSMFQSPSLYEQLKSDLAGMQGENKSPAKSLPPIWVDACQLLADIDGQVSRWLPRRRGSTPGRLGILSDRPWRPQDTDHVSTLARTVDQWCEQITHLIDPQSVKHISAPCPSCGKKTIYRKDQAGEVVRQPALRIVAHIGCTCQACGAHWAPDRYLWLVKLLGFELPEGVLE
jgi:predicted RNA-binding Zn-ribbon protein involved in translation (DUF1610 family)